MQNPISLSSKEVKFPLTASVAEIAAFLDVPPTEIRRTIRCVGIKPVKKGVYPAAFVCREVLEMARAETPEPDDFEIPQDAIDAMIRDLEAQGGKHD
ncbi:hypothetical protein [Paracoccus sp. (in: a-proteobacteria)]|uniref:hypothetical protein n=1 Tax=Paracoccus sp. TaxID=267 RepID=UPI002AFFFDC8|nr:hypothetical protein [Paracoccus sp. (in: a-proteobacteria)]